MLEISFDESGIWHRDGVDEGSVVVGSERGIAFQAT
jgi:hypothetical protein